MSEKVNGAPKSTESKVTLDSGKETQQNEPKGYFKTSAEYFSEVEARRKDMEGESVSATTDTYRSYGGDTLDKLREELASNPENASLKKQVEQAETAVYERYLNDNNEFAQLNEKDRKEVYDTVAAEMPSADDPQYFQKLLELEKSLIADGGITQSQVQYVFTKAMNRNERYANASVKEAPTDLPTTAEAAAAAGELEKNGKKANLIRRAWDWANFKVGYGMFAVGDFMARRTQKEEQKKRRLEGETDEQYSARLEKIGRRANVGAALGAAAIGGAYLGYRAWALNKGIEANGIGGMIDGESGAGEVGQGSLGSLTETMPESSIDNSELPVLPGEANLDAGNDAVERIAESTERGGVGSFEGTMFDGYNPAEDAFNMPGKTGAFNWGAPIPTELAADAHFEVAGLDEMTAQSWATSPEQLATVAKHFGIEGFDAAGLEDMAEQMKANPDFGLDTYTQMLDILNDPNTRISEGAPLEPGTYGSYYETMVDGNGVVCYDEVVNEPGTVIKVEFTDQNGVDRVIELKRECGGQVIFRHPVEAATVPMGGAEYTTVTPNDFLPPQGGATPPVETTLPPTGGTPPPEVTPPTGGDTPPPEEGLTPKNALEDINANPLLPEYLKMGDQAGTIQPGDLDLTQVEPPAEYTPEPAPSVSTEVADGAVPNDRTEVGDSAPEVTVPAPETGVSGESADDVVTGQVEG